MPVVADHPSPELIKSLAAGTLSGPDADAVESHLENCGVCLDIAKKLSLDPLEDRLRDALTPPTHGVLLTVLAGPHKGRAFRFGQHDTFLVGRSAQAHFSLPDDPFFSRWHFMIEVNPPSCRLVDLQSKSGTLVNGKREPAVDLKDGDLIQGGTTVLRVSIEHAAAPFGATLSLPGELSDTNVSAWQHDSGMASTRKDHDPGRRAEDVPQVPGYRMVGEVGRGGMGSVYRAVRIGDGKEVAIKIILPRIRSQEQVVQRFLREARILSELRHPHIVEFCDMGQTDGLLYFAMDFVEGVDSGRLVSEQGPLAVGRAVGLMLQVLEALAHAHERGFVHRDLKPPNILLARGTGQETAWVADFGLARAYQNSPMSGLTLSDTIAGTPQYMAPEQVRDFRNVQPAADQYAAAATLYYWLCGVAHFAPTQSVHAFFRQILQEEPIPIQKHRPDIAPPLAAAVHRALARQPENRFASAAAFAAAIGGFAAS